MAESLLPGGYHIEEDPASHAYYKVYPGGKRERVPSPSQLGSAFKSTIRAPKSEVEAAEWEWKRDRGSWFGDRVHEILHARLSGAAEPSRAAFTYEEAFAKGKTQNYYEDARRAADEMLKEMERQGLTPVASEVMLHDSRTGITGRADLVARDRNNNLRVVDWKTNSRDPVTGAYPSASYPVQLHTYAGADHMFVDGQWQPVSLKGATLLHHSGQPGSATSYDLKRDSHTQKVLRDVQRDLLLALSNGTTVPVPSALRGAFRVKSGTSRVNSPKISGDQARADIAKRRVIPVAAKQRILSKTTLTRLRQSSAGSRPIMAFDLETTGRGSEARVTEFGAVRVNREGKYESIHQTVYKQKVGEPAAAALSGLYQPHLDQGAAMDRAALQKIHNLMQGSRVVTWNGGGDFDWLAGEAERAGVPDLAKSFREMKSDPKVHLDALTEARALGITPGRGAVARDPRLAREGLLPNNKLITWKHVAKALGRDVSAGSHGAVADSLYTLYALDAMYGQEHVDPAGRGELLRQQLADHGTQILEGSSRESHEEDVRKALAQGLPVPEYESPVSANAQIEALAAGQAPEPPRQPRGALQASGMRVRSGVTGSTVQQRAVPVAVKAVQHVTRERKEGSRVGIDESKSVFIEDSLRSWKAKVANVERDLLKMGPKSSQYRSHVMSLLEPYRAHVFQDVWAKDTSGQYQSDPAKFAHLSASWPELTADVTSFLDRPNVVSNQEAQAYGKKLAKRIDSLPVPKLVQAAPPVPLPVIPPTPPGTSSGGGGGGKPRRGYYNRVVAALTGRMSYKGFEGQPHRNAQVSGTNPEELTLGHLLSAADKNMGGDKDPLWGHRNQAIGQLVRSALSAAGHGELASHGSLAGAGGVYDRLGDVLGALPAHERGRLLGSRPELTSDASQAGLGALREVYGSGTTTQWRSKVAEIEADRAASLAADVARKARDSDGSGRGADAGGGGGYGGGGGGGRPPRAPMGGDDFPFHGDPMLMALLGAAGATSKSAGYRGTPIPSMPPDPSDFGTDAAGKLKLQEAQRKHRNAVEKADALAAYERAHASGLATGDLEEGGEYFTPGKHGMSNAGAQKLKTALDEAGGKAHAAMIKFLEKELQATTEGFMTDAERARHIKSSPEVAGYANSASAMGRQSEFAARKKQMESRAQMVSLGMTGEMADQLSQRDYDLEKQQQAERQARDNKRLRSGSRGTVQHLFEQATGSSNPMEYLGKRVTQTAVWATSGMAYYGLMNMTGRNWASIREVQRDQAALEQALGTAENPMNKADKTKLSQDVLGMSGTYGFAPERILDVALALQGTVSDTSAKSGERMKNTEEATKAVVLLSKVGRTDLTQSMENLIAISNSYNPSNKPFYNPKTDGPRQTNADVMMNTVNGLTALSNKYGVNIEQTSTAMARMGDIFKTMGVKAPDAAGWLGAIQRATGESGLQITSKLERVFPALLNPETAADVTRILGPKDIGIDYRDFMGEIDLTKFVDKVGRGYANKQINDSDLQSLGMVVGGPRGYGEFVKLIQNYDKAKKMSDTYARPGQAAEERWKVLSQTANEQLNKFAGEWLMFAKNIASAGILQTFGAIITGAQHLVHWFNSLFNVINLGFAKMPGGETIRNILGLGLGLKALAAIKSSTKPLGSLPVLGSIIGNSRSPIGEAYRDMSLSQMAHSIRNPNAPIFVNDPKAQEERILYQLHRGYSPEIKSAIREVNPVTAGLMSGAALQVKQFTTMLTRATRGVYDFSKTLVSGLTALSVRAMGGTQGASLSNRMNQFIERQAGSPHANEAAAFAAGAPIGGLRGKLERQMAIKWLKKNEWAGDFNDEATINAAIGMNRGSEMMSAGSLGKMRLSSMAGRAGVVGLGIAGVAGVVAHMNTLGDQAGAARADFRKDYSSSWGVGASIDERRAAVQASRERMESMQSGHHALLDSVPVLGGLFKTYDRTYQMKGPKDQEIIDKHQGWWGDTKSHLQRHPWLGLPWGSVSEDELTKQEQATVDKQLAKQQEKESRGLARVASKRDITVLAPEDQQWLVQNLTQAATYGGVGLDITGTLGKGAAKQTLSGKVRHGVTVDDVKAGMQEQLKAVNLEIQHAEKDAASVDYKQGLVDWKNKLVQTIKDFNTQIYAASLAVQAAAGTDLEQARANFTIATAQWRDLGDKTTPEALQKMAEMVQGAVGIAQAAQSERMSAVGGLGNAAFSTGQVASNAQLAFKTQLDYFQMMQKAAPGSGATRQAGLDALSAWRAAEDQKFQSKMSMIDAKEHLETAGTSNTLDQFAIRRKYIGQRMEAVSQRENQFSTGNETLDKFLEQLKSETAAPLTEAAGVLKATIEGSMTVAGQNQLTASTTMAAAASIIMNAANTIAAAAGVKAAGDPLDSSQATTASGRAERGRSATRAGVHSRAASNQAKYGTPGPNQYITNPTTGKDAPVGQLWEKTPVRFPNGKPTGEYTYKLVDAKRGLVHEHEAQAPGAGGGAHGGTSGRAAPHTGYVGVGALVRGGSVTSGYGQRGGEFHTGIDIDGKMGDAIHAARGGTVTQVKDLGGRSYGKYVVVRGKDGKEYYYAHMSGQSVQVGQHVKAGQILGQVGNTGNVRSTTGDGSHLHYEVRSGGHSIDPTPYLPGGSKGTGPTTSSGTTTGSGGSAAMTDLQAQDMDIARQEAQYLADAYAAQKMSAAGPASQEKQVVATISGLKAELRTAKTWGGDPLRVAQLELELKKAYYDQAKLRIDEMTASFMLAKDTSNQVTMYTVKIKQLKAQMAAYLAAGGKKTDAEYIGMQSEVQDAKRDKGLQQVEYGLDTASYKYKMHESSWTEYLANLKKLRDKVDTSTHAGKELWRSINEQIQSMLDGMALNANIPSEIKMPTLYEVRRFMGAKLDPNQYAGTATGITVPTGGPSPSAYAIGGSFGAGDLFMAGERGPELIRMNGGGDVMSAARTAALMNGSQTPTVHKTEVNIQVDGADTGHILNIMSQYLGPVATSRTSYTNRKV